MIDGTYKIQMDSPVGVKEGTTVLITSGEKLTGSLTAMGVQIDVRTAVTDRLQLAATSLLWVPTILAVGGSVEGDHLASPIANRDFVFGHKES